MGRGRCKYAYVTVGYATVGRAIPRQIFLKIAVKLLSAPSNPQPRRCVTTARSSWFALLAAVRGPAASRQIWFLAGRWPDWCARRCEAPASDCPAPGQAGHAERSSLRAPSPTGARAARTSRTGLVRRRAPGGGFEPPLTGSKPVVMPLDHPGLPLAANSTWIRRGPDGTRGVPPWLPWGRRRYAGRPAIWMRALPRPSAPSVTLLSRRSLAGASSRARQPRRWPSAAAGKTV